MISVLVRLQKYIVKKKIMWELTEREEMDRQSVETAM